MGFSTPSRTTSLLLLLGALSIATEPTAAFAPTVVPQQAITTTASTTTQPTTSALGMVSRKSDDEVETQNNNNNNMPLWKHAANLISGVAVGVYLTASVTFAGPVWAENELSDKYGGAGLDTSLVDQTCLIDKCSLQAKACLADDANCRKGLTCTGKCLGDNACITGCMARYGNVQLDNFLKCTIEDNECIKIAILEGGADPFGQEPRAPAPTLANFDPKTLEGSWYKVAGYNPNYDCYACQRNSFSVAGGSGSLKNAKGGVVDQLQMEVEFSMPHLLPDGSPPPPSNTRELVSFVSDNSAAAGPQSIGLNSYHTRETMVFDQVRGTGKNVENTLVWDKKGAANEGMTYARTAHSEGEMFGLKFWENWYILGENDPGTPEFKFVFYNGKTRQNTYEGAFVYSRTKELSPESMSKVYQIAKDAGMNPDQFCRIRNGCFADEENGPALMNNGAAGQRDIPFRGILASTKVSEILGVESVAALDMVRRDDARTAEVLQPPPSVLSQQEAATSPAKRAWWYEVGDYLENPHRHFRTMDSLRVPMEWPKDVIAQNQQ